MPVFRNLARHPLFPGTILLAGIFLATASAADEGRWTLVDQEHGKVLHRADGQPVFRYLTDIPEGSALTANSACCLYPVYTPSGERAVEFAPADHRHHRGVYLAWHSLRVGDQRADFWGWDSLAPTETRVIRNRRVELVDTDAEQAQVAVHNAWMLGEEVLVDERLTITARQEGQAYVLELDFRLTPQAPLEIEQTAFGGFCVRGRMAEDRTIYNSQGLVERPNPHHMEPERNWPAEPWYAYQTRLEDGRVVGAAVVDHPDNPPTTWHNIVGWGMINPCIAAPAAVRREAEQPLRLRYVLVVHDGEHPRELLQQLSRDHR